MAFGARATVLLFCLVFHTWSFAGEFEVPSGFIWHEYPERLFLPATEFPQNCDGRLVVFRYPQFLARYDWLRIALVTKFGRPTQIDSVFYPMSSFDVTLPVVVFPEASTYVFVDNHPVYDRANLPTKLSPRYRKEFDVGFLFGGLGRSGCSYVGADLLGDVLRHIPGAFIHSVSLFYRSDETTFDWESNLPAVHMKVVFEFSKMKKTLYYINSMVGPKPGEKEDTFVEPWWVHSLERLRPGAVIVKGQGQAQDSTRYDARYLKWLKIRNGFLLFDQRPEKSPLLADTNSIEGKLTVDLQQPFDSSVLRSFGYTTEPTVLRYRP